MRRRKERSRLTHKLDGPQIVALLEAYAGEVPVDDIAERFKVSKSTVRYHVRKATQGKG